MVKLDIKPLSINRAYKGRLTKTTPLRKYITDLAFLLPANYKVPKPPLELHLEWGFSSRGSDWDNPIKPFQDALAKKYGFNDNQIYRAVVEKRIVPKGQEYIKFKLIKHSKP